MSKINQSNATKQVFSFTLARQLEAKSYRLITILLAAVCFLLPAVIMPCAEAFGKHTAKADEPSPVTDVYVVDNTPVSVDFNFLNQMGNPVFRVFPIPTAGAVSTERKSLPMQIR